MMNDLMCLKCKNFNLVSGGCKAFPDGIPYEITNNGVKHYQPLPDQPNNIVYEYGRSLEEILITPAND